LEGQEKGWNDNAFHRSIIMHPAGYVSEEQYPAMGFLGRSEGCPAIPEELDRPIIDSIRVEAAFLYTVLITNTCGSPGWLMIVLLKISIHRTFKYFLCIPYKVQVPHKAVHRIEWQG